MSEICFVVSGCFYGKYWLRLLSLVSCYVCVVFGENRCLVCYVEEELLLCNY